MSPVVAVGRLCTHQAVLTCCGHPEEMLLVPWLPKLLAHTPLVYLLASSSRVLWCSREVTNHGCPGQSQSLQKCPWRHQHRVAELVLPQPHCMRCQGPEGSRRPFCHG